MLNPEMLSILESAQDAGWILEPEAKRLLALAGIPVPDFTLAATAAEAVAAAKRIGYPIVAKVVSPAIVHKSDAGGVTVGIQDAAHLTEIFNRFSALEGFVGLLVEEMLAGTELIVGAKIDFQFGPVVLLGIGGTGVEIYQDTRIRMAPISERDVHAMLEGLRGTKLLKGYRGAEPIRVAELQRLLLSFSALVMELGDRIESFDLNPVKCDGRRCVAADARIMLAPENFSVSRAKL
jgi:acyl-CoA synthetase (NDP forming)